VRKSSAIGGVRTSIDDERTDTVDERTFIDGGGTFPREPCIFVYFRGQKRVAGQFQ